MNWQSKLETDQSEATLLAFAESLEPIDAQSAEAIRGFVRDGFRPIYSPWSRAWTLPPGKFPESAKLWEGKSFEMCQEALLAAAAATCS